MDLPDKTNLPKALLVWVFIAFIGIMIFFLIDIGLPSFGGMDQVGDRMRRSKCMSNLRAIAEAIKSYAESHSGMLPAQINEVFLSESFHVEKENVEKELEKYFRCPTRDRAGSKKLNFRFGYYGDYLGDYAYLGSGVNLKTCDKNRIILMDKHMDPAWSGVPPVFNAITAEFSEIHVDGQHFTLCVSNDDSNVGFPTYKELESETMILRYGLSGSSVYDKSTEKWNFVACGDCYHPMWEGVLNRLNNNFAFVGNIGTVAVYDYSKHQWFSRRAYWGREKSAVIFRDDAVKVGVENGPIIVYTREAGWTEGGK